MQGRKRLISANGGRSPVWSLDGKELFYIEGTDVMAAPVETGVEFSAGRPALLLTEFRVVQNWFEELKRLSPSP